MGQPLPQKCHSEPQAKNLSLWEQETLHPPRRTQGDTIQASFTLRGVSAGQHKRLLKIPLILLPLLLLLAAISCDRGAKSPTLTPPPTPQPTTIAPPFTVINGHTFHLEIPKDEDAFYQGLGNRTSLPEDSAMLFIYQQEGFLSFWMKDTLIALDILFLDSSRKIVDIQTMQPEPGVPDYDLHNYMSSIPAMYAIEMNAGLSEKFGFMVGMVVELNINP